jgi:ubiquinol-cytochrome c reductase cytochrome c1 subunit
MKRILACGLAAVAALAGAAAVAQEVHMDSWPAERANDLAALQSGARLFVNYCLSCHGAPLMRWNRLREIGLDEKEIQTFLIFGNQRVGDTMTVSMNPRDAKAWFGKAPPDLSVIVRARNTVEHRGTDYVYTLLRGYYRDRSTLTGWNNVVYPKIAMPNIFWERQGPREATLTQIEREEVPAKDEKGGTVEKLVRVISSFDTDGNVTIARTELDHGEPGFEYHFKPLDEKAAASTDSDVADLVAYLNWMSEPTAGTRFKVGVWAMTFLVVFAGVARWLDAVFWRDIKAS